MRRKMTPSSMRLAYCVFTALVVVQVSDACSPTADPEDFSNKSLAKYMERFCDSDLVFRGRAVSNTSREDGNALETLTTFSVAQYFRDTTKAQAKEVKVSVKYNLKQLCCRPEPFDPRARDEDILVLALSFGGDSLSFPCAGHPLWKDVPSEFARVVKERDPCGEGGVIGLPVAEASSPPDTNNKAVNSTHAPVKPKVTIFPFNAEVQCLVEKVHGVMTDTEIDFTGVDKASSSYTAEFVTTGRTPICTVDLTTCPSVVQQGCYCRKVQGPVYSLRMAMPADVALSRSYVKVVLRNNKVKTILRATEISGFVVAESKPTQYPDTRRKITSRLWSSDGKYYDLKTTRPLIPVGRFQKEMTLTYEVMGARPPYIVLIRANPGGPTTVADSVPAAYLTVDLSYGGVTLKYQEYASDNCSRTFSKTFAFMAVGGSNSLRPAYSLSLLAIAVVAIFSKVTR